MLFLALWLPVGSAVPLICPAPDVAAPDVGSIVLTSIDAFDGYINDADAQLTEAFSACGGGYCDLEDGSSFHRIVDDDVWFAEVGYEITPPPGGDLRVLRLYIGSDSTSLRSIRVTWEGTFAPDLPPDASLERHTNGDDIDQRIFGDCTLGHFGVLSASGHAIYTVNGVAYSVDENGDTFSYHVNGELWGSCDWRIGVAPNLDSDGDRWCDLDDCDTMDPFIHPEAMDLEADGIDEDCDGFDFIDLDNDGYSAEAPEGQRDCDDTTMVVNPAQREVLNDGLDNDCDGLAAIDADGDDYASVESGGDDCDDSNRHIHPRMSDSAEDGIDNDCSGAPGDDNDHDGSSSVESGGDDCDDTDASVHPGAVDPLSNSDDTNCDGVNGYDVDHDSYLSLASGGDDCDDSNHNIHPDSEDPRGDWVDQNCDGVDGLAGTDTGLLEDTDSATDSGAGSDTDSGAGSDTDSGAGSDTDSGAGSDTRPEQSTPTKGEDTRGPLCGSPLPLGLLALLRLRRSSRLTRGAAC